MKIEIEQNTPEWDALRKKSIGASDWPIILGISPYKTPWQLWGEKLGFRESEYTQAMRHGHAIEDAARLHISDQEGETFVPCVIQHDELSWLLASLDGFCDVLQTGLEIKSTNEATFKDLEDGKIPDHWYTQIQAQMFVGGYEKTILFAQNKDRKFTTEVYFDDLYILENLKTIRDFYQSLIDGEPPEMSERDYVIVDSDDFYELEKEYVSVKKAHDLLKEKLDDVKKKIEDFGDDGNFEGQLISVTRISREGNVDWQALARSINIPKETIESFRKKQIGYYSIRFKNA